MWCDTPPQPLELLQHHFQPLRNLLKTFNTTFERMNKWLPKLNTISVKNPCFKTLRYPPRRKPARMHKAGCGLVCTIGEWRNVKDAKQIPVDGSSSWKRHEGRSCECWCCFTLMTSWWLDAKVNLVGIFQRRMYNKWEWSDGVDVSQLQEGSFCQVRHVTLKTSNLKSTQNAGKRRRHPWKNKRNVHVASACGERRKPVHTDGRKESMRCIHVTTFASSANSWHADEIHVHPQRGEVRFSGNTRVGASWWDVGCGGLVRCNMDQQEKRVIARWKTWCDANSWSFWKSES